MKKEINKNVSKTQTIEQEYKTKIMTLQIENLQKDLELLELRNIMRIYKNPWNNELETLLITVEDAYKASQKGLLLSHLFDANRLLDAHKAIELLVAKYGYMIFYQTITTTLSILITNTKNKIKELKKVELPKMKEKSIKDK